MAVDNQKLARSRGGDTAEENNGVTYPAGLYRHENGQEAIIQTDPLYGDGQAQAFVRAGFEYVREAKPEEIKNLGVPSLDKESQPKKNLVDSSDLKGVQARLDALEAENATLKNKLSSGSEVPGTEAVPGAEQTKEAGVNQANRLSGNEVTTPPVDEDEDEKSLSQQNVSELRATAEAEGVEFTEDNTKKELKEAIEAKRVEVAAAGENEEGNE